MGHTSHIIMMYYIKISILCPVFFMYTGEIHHISGEKSRFSLANFPGFR